MSAAFDIFLAGDFRVLHPNSILMCHSGNAALNNQPLPSISIEAELHEAYFKRWAKFYSGRTKIKEEDWLKVLKGGLNRYFFPEEALEKGLAHKVIIPRSKTIKKLDNLRW
jgi:ATP-dependent protease ClpP protease subunit